MILWTFDSKFGELKIADQRVLNSDMGSYCNNFSIVCSQQVQSRRQTLDSLQVGQTIQFNSSETPYFSSASNPGSPKSPTMSVSEPEVSSKVHFVTSHQTGGTNSFLHIWSYCFSNHDLFLDKAIEFDCKLSMVKGCPDFTGNIYVQRASEKKEVLIMNREGNVKDKIDQNSDIQDIIPYEGSTVIFKVTKPLEQGLFEKFVIFYDLNRKKILRHMREVG